MVRRAETAHSVSGPLVAELVLAGLDCYTEPILLKVGSFDGRMISGFTVYLINLIPWDGFSLGRHKSTKLCLFRPFGKDILQISKDSQDTFFSVSTLSPQNWCLLPDIAPFIGGAAFDLCLVKQQGSSYCLPSPARQHSSALHWQSVPGWRHQRPVSLSVVSAVHLNFQARLLDRNNPLCVLTGHFERQGHGDLQSQLPHMTALIKLQPFTRDSVCQSLAVSTTEPHSCQDKWNVDCCVVCYLFRLFCFSLIHLSVTS